MVMDRVSLIAWSHCDFTVTVLLHNDSWWHHTLHNAIDIDCSYNATHCAAMILPCITIDCCLNICFWFSVAATTHYDLPAASSSIGYHCCCCCCLLVLIFKRIYSAAMVTVNACRMTTYVSDAMPLPCNDANASTIANALFVDCGVVIITSWLLLLKNIYFCCCTCFAAKLPRPLLLVFALVAGLSLF